MQNSKEIELKADQYGKITGACKLTILEGDLAILNKNLTEQDEIIIPAHKSFPIATTTDVKLRVRCGKEHCFEKLETNPIPTEWSDLHADLQKRIETASKERDLGKDPFRIAILGESIGKSTQSIYHMNGFLAKGYKVALIDADLGQQTLSIPTTISKALVRTPIFYTNELPPDRTRFVGHIKGTNRVSFIQNHRILELCTDKLGEDIIIIDTDSWITEIGLDYKRYLIQIAKLDFCIIVGAEMRDPLQALAQTCEKNDVPHQVLLHPNRHYYERSREKRKEHREMQYHTYFQDAVERNYPLQKITLFLEQPDKKSERITWIKYSPRLFRIKPGTILGAYNRQRQFVGACVFQKIYNKHIYILQRPTKAYIRYLVIGEATIE